MEDSYLHFRCYSGQARDLLTDRLYMERSTLLAELWNATPEKGSNKAAEVLAESTRQRLEAGELIPTGNCRNVERAYWARNEEE